MILGHVVRFQKSEVVLSESCVRFGILLRIARADIVVLMCRCRSAL